MGILLGKWKLVAALAAVLALSFSVWYIYQRGRDAEKAIIAEKIQDNVKAANEIQNRTMRTSDADVYKRLRRWQRD